MPSGVQILESTGGVWSFAKTDSPYNSARVGRWHDLAFLTEGASSSLTQSRAGVLPGPGWTTGASPASLFVSPTGSGLNVQVFPGTAVVERGTFSGTGWSSFTSSGTGPYTSHLRSTATFAVNTASTSSTRIDRVDFQIMDGPGYGDNSGVSYGYILYTPGTAGSGVPANAPANSIPLALITIPANTTTLTSGMFTDTRRAASVRGCPRILLPGDSLSDPGFAAGEERMRYHTTYGWLVDYWDPVSSLWRGTQEFAGITQTWANGTSNITLIGGSTYNQIISVAVADPGWPYRLRVSSRIRVDYASTWPVGTATWGPPFVTMQVGVNSTTDTSMGVANSWPPPTVIAAQFYGSTAETTSAKLTGASTVYLSALGQGSGGTGTCQYSFFSGAGGSNQTNLDVAVIPAGI